MLGRGLSIIRWNNFPRAVDIKHMDNVGFTLHVWLYLAYLEEQESGMRIDKLFLMKKIIFSSLADLLLSDINSGTKGYIEKADKKIFSDLYQKAFNHIYAFEWPDFLTQDIKNVVEDKSHHLESQLFYAAKKYVWHVEAATNARVFPEMYEVPSHDIESSLENISQRLPSLAFLLEDTKSQKYLSHIQRLSFAMRWNQYQRVSPISVMSHKVVVAYLAYVIWTYMNHEWSDCDVEDMMMRAIYHDVPEVITWDIITPTKKAVPGFVELLEEVETDMVEDYLFSYISPEYKQYISPYMLAPFEWETWKKVKYADNLSALFEAKLEVIQWNKNFDHAAKKIMKDVSKEENEAVEYILKDMVLYFEEIREDILN